MKILYVAFFIDLCKHEIIKIKTTRKQSGENIKKQFYEFYFQHLSVILKLICTLKGFRPKSHFTTILNLMLKSLKKQ